VDRFIDWSLVDEAKDDRLIDPSFSPNVLVPY